MNYNTFKLREWRLFDAASLAENANNINIWNNLRDGLPHPYSKNDGKESVSIDPLKIQVDVSVVRLDVVVLDNKGCPITDLSAYDFEIIQDGLPQEVISSFYIRNQADAL